MIRTIMAATAVSVFAFTAALAQSTAPSVSGTTVQSTAPGSQASFVARQNPDQFLASKFRGTDVVGANNEKIGGVSDILFDKDGKVIAYVVGVGGFLGIGSKDVALAPDSFQIVPGDTPVNFKLRLAMSKDQLKAATAFEPYAPPRPAVSQNPPAAPITGLPPLAPSQKQ